jgi:acyl-CoA synthetase (AMP-forming)/AMP-acid ligase II
VVPWSAWVTGTTPKKTAERYKPLPTNTPGRDRGLVLPEIAVFSGDTVRRDEEGFLYFIGRRDEMMKTSGYRVSPTEVEEVIYATRLVGECVAFGVDHPTLGQAIQVIATPAAGGTLDTAALLAECRDRVPAYMLPTEYHRAVSPLPRNPQRQDRPPGSGQRVPCFDRYARARAGIAHASENGSAPGDSSFAFRSSPAVRTTHAPVRLQIVNAEHRGNFR